MEALVHNFGSLRKLRLADLPYGLEDDQCQRPGPSPLRPCLDCGRGEWVELEIRRSRSTSNCGPDKIACGVFGAGKLFKRDHKLFKRDQMLGRRTSSPEFA